MGEYRLFVKVWKIDIEPNLPPYIWEKHWFVPNFGKFSDYETCEARGQNIMLAEGEIDYLWNHLTDS